MPLRTGQIRELPTKDIRTLDAFFKKIEVEADFDSVGPDQLQNGSVGNPELRDSAACSVIGRAANSQGDPGDIAASANGQFMVRRSDALVFGALAETDIPGEIARDSEVATAIAFALVGYEPLSAVLPLLHAGSGSPEGVLTAPVGHLYLRSDGGANTTLYIKESGAGNTGWTAK